MHKFIAFIGLFAFLTCAFTPATAQSAQVRDLGRFDGWRDNALIGYGLVTGLAGSGDSRRSTVTRQALRNVLSRLGTSVSEEEISSRNVAVVVVMAVLPASANVGDRINVTVSSIGDARSLAGGTLLMTPLMGPNQRTYALAQGPLLVGGYRFEANDNLQQRNHPTTGRLEGGATIETAVDSSILNAEGQLAFLLHQPDFGTAQQIADQIDARFGRGTAIVRNADEVRIIFRGSGPDLAGFVSVIETMSVIPSTSNRIVINERTGTIVSGANVAISPVVISQGDIRVTVESQNQASQPAFFSGLASDVSSLVVANTRLAVEPDGRDATVRFGNTTIADLVQGLARLNVDTRRIITILQALKAAGALQAEIVVQ